jgi:hypothetical protein
MPVAAGTRTALSPQITGDMNMESVFAWWQLGKSCNDFHSSNYVTSHGFTDNIGSRKHSDCHSYYEQRIIVSFVHNPRLVTI